MPAAAQAHQPHHFYVAWTIAMMAAGKKTGKQTFDHTVWIEALPERTVFHASNASAYVRVTIPTKPNLLTDDDGWRMVAYDPVRQIQSIATRCKQKDPNQQGLTELGGQVLITCKGQRVTIEYDDDFTESTIASTIPAADVDWPFEVIATLDRHETDPTAEMAWPPDTAQFVARVGRILGVSITLRLNGLTAAFDVTHPIQPEVRVQGTCATKAP